MENLKKVERANELVKTIKDAETELTALFGGEPVRQRAAQKCSKCGSQNHNARNCDQQGETPKL